MSTLLPGKIHSPQTICAINKDTCLLDVKQANLFKRSGYMEKIDYKKELKALYNPSAKEPSIVDAPEMKFLMIDGEGDPNKEQSFQDAVEALYGVSYTLKFVAKKDLGTDYTVMPLEGLWWADDMSRFDIEDKSSWKWTLMIMQPAFITEELFKEAVEQVEKKKNPPALSKIRFESLHEGLSAQIMHIGPFSEEGPTIERLHAFIKDRGHRLSGKHHEIYLSDIRKVNPAKMKTVIRQPIV